MRLRTIAAAGCVGALALGAAACGDDDSGGGGSTSGGGGESVNIYSSLPLQGASKDQTAAMVNGIKLALEEAHNKAGNVTINYQSLDDSTAQMGNWDPGQTAQNARKVAQDDNAIGYIGEFNSGASVISIPILNEAGIPQVSPANTYVGLTTDEPGSEEGEPAKYYPTGNRTYLRIVPRDTIQSAALLTLMKQDGCQNVAIANDKETYGAGLARLMEIQSGDIGVNISSNEGIDKSAPNFRAYAQKIKGDGADCFFFSGVTANGAVQITKDVAAAIPGVKLYGPDGVCESGFTNPASNGIPKSIAPQFKCTVATLNLQSYPGGQEFLDAYKAKYGNANPDPYAIYGYEAMKLFIDTLSNLGDQATDRAAVLQALFDTKDRDSVLGTYSFDENGDTTLTDYGVYEVGKDGNPEFAQAIKAQGAAQ
ncbi:MAG TPA: branched-chain amino acid ABC transporter substrate-binding protein [Capillimicrobium sp.]|nr:branched-chain amino acid ABC transporter substrate-binding protein [Capillimicrobium sp.]